VSSQKSHRSAKRVRTSDSPSTAATPAPSATERGLRAILLGILLLSMVGTGVELLLLEHTETFSQLIPLLCLAAGLVALLGAALRPTSFLLRLLQVVMAINVLSGLVGLYLHLKGNREFELEMYPTMQGFELFKESMMGATPALAPGAMAWLGLLGLAYTYRHPKLRETGAQPGGLE
jgi:hypothetical protein